jgi:CBS domain-containing protein
MKVIVPLVPLPIEAVDADAPLDRALHLINTRRAPLLAVLSEGRLVGLLPEDISARRALVVAAWGNVRISEAMLPGATTIMEDALAQDALRLMNQLDLTHLIVCAEDGSLLGLLEKDLFAEGVPGEVRLGDLVRGSLVQRTDGHPSLI